MKNTFHPRSLEPCNLQGRDGRPRNLAALPLWGPAPPNRKRPNCRRAVEAANFRRKQLRAHRGGFHHAMKTHTRERLSDPTEHVHVHDTHTAEACAHCRDRGREARRLLLPPAAPPAQALPLPRTLRLRHLGTLAKLRLRSATRGAYLAVGSSWRPEGCARRSAVSASAGASP